MAKKPQKGGQKARLDRPIQAPSYYPLACVYNLPILPPIQMLLWSYNPHTQKNDYGSIHHYIHKMAPKPHALQ